MLGETNVNIGENTYMYIPYEGKLKNNELTQLEPNTKFAVR